MNIANATGEETGIVTLHSETAAGTAQTIASFPADKLAAGSYAVDVNVKTDGNYGSDDKARIKILTADNTELASYTYTKAEALQRLLSEQTGRYDTLRVDFTLPQDKAGQDVKIQVESFDGTDFWLRGVDLKQYTTEERLEADQIVSGIAAIGVLTEQNTFEKIDAIEAMEQAYKAYVEKFGPEKADQNITNAADLKKAREDYDSFYANADEEALKKMMAKAAEKAIGEIVAFGSGNMREGQRLVEAAEAAVQRLTDEYGEAAAELVANLDQLAAARERLDYLLTYYNDRYTEESLQVFHGRRSGGPQSR